jgi:hypothetical protein
MTKIQTTLKRKIGPLPLWAWILLIGAAIALGLYLRNRQGSKPESTLDNIDNLPPVEEPAPDVGGGSNGSGSGGGGYLPGYPDLGDIGSGDTGGGLPDIPPPQEPTSGYVPPTTPQEAASAFPAAPSTSTKTQDLSKGVLRWNFAKCGPNPARTIWHNNAADKALFKRHLNCRGITIATFKANHPAAAAFWGW